MISQNLVQTGPLDAENVKKFANFVNVAKKCQVRNETNNMKLKIWVASVGKMY